MKKIWSRVWWVVKKFPLSVFAVFVLTASLIVQNSGATYDSQGVLGALVLLLILLNYPFRLANEFATFLGMSWLVELFDPPLLGVCFFLLLLDLLILYLRKCIIPAVRGNNPKLLIPSIRFKKREK